MKYFCARCNFETSDETEIKCHQQAHLPHILVKGSVNWTEEEK